MHAYTHTAKSMIEHAQEAKKAYEAGDFAKAGEQKKLKEQMREAMLESNRKAVASIIDPQNWKDTGKLDLHGLYVAEATEVSREMLNHFYDQGNVKKASVEIVTGAGHHSINNKALIKPAILKLLEGKVAYEMEHDGGCIVVNMNGMLVDESHAIIF